MLEDRRILKRLKKGDREALRAVYEKYKDSLRTIAGSMLHDMGAGEDVLHDVFVAFARKARELQIKGSLRNYLIGCVANRVRDEYRRKNVHTVELDHAEPVCSHSDGPDNRIMADETTQVLAHALASIPFEQREVVVLHLKGSLTFREIARMQNITLSTVHGRYRYGLKKLRTLLNGEFSNGSC
ncbi:MAG: RNA polymerase sigma factor [Planctomycetota bacterium]|jgi:RNA polymerase sigma-70 factor (ECF subfamily)